MNAGFAQNVLVTTLQSGWIRALGRPSNNPNSMSGSVEAPVAHNVGLMVNNQKWRPTIVVKLKMEMKLD